LSNTLNRPRNVLRFKFFEGKKLATGGYGLGEFAEIGGHQNDDKMGRRLFQKFQQTVEGIIGQGVGFIYDVDFFGSDNGTEVTLGNQSADIINPPEIPAVYFPDVPIIPLKDGLTVLALPAGLTIAVFIEAIDGAGDYPRHGGLTGAGTPEKTVTVPELLCPRLLFQDFGHLSLSDDIAKPMGSTLVV